MIWLPGCGQSRFLKAGTVATRVGFALNGLPGARRRRCMVFAVPNVRAKRATTAGRQARPQENVHRTLRPGLVACRWRSA